MSPVPGAEPAPKDPIGRLSEHPKSKQRQEKVVAAIQQGSIEVADLDPLFLDHDKDLVRAAAWIASKAEAADPLTAPKVLPRIEDSDKRTAMAVIDYLAEMLEKDREASVLALGETELARQITELMDVARPRELKEALNGDDKLRARVAVAEVIRRGDKGEALLYEARSQKDKIVSGAALATLRSMFLAGSLQPRARIDRFWLWRQKFRP